MVLTMLCTFFKAFSQDKPSVQSLRIGDKMPDVKITQIINSRLKPSLISDFYGKLIILDFWSTWCSSCIKGFPELDSIQRKFANKIQILLVNPKKENDSKRSVEIVIDRVNDWSGKKLKLPVVFQDTVLTKYFQFQTIPHCVWINQQGVVVAITGKEDVTAGNILKILKGEKLFLTVKND
jgi:thiol-disulfide isomerase/thioredoxin